MLREHPGQNRDQRPPPLRRSPGVPRTPVAPAWGSGRRAGDQPRFGLLACSWLHNTRAAVPVEPWALEVLASRILGSGSGGQTAAGGRGSSADLGGSANVDLGVRGGGGSDSAEQAKAGSTCPTPPPQDSEFLELLEQVGEAVAGGAGGNASGL